MVAGMLLPEFLFLDTQIGRNWAQLATHHNRPESAADHSHYHTPALSLPALRRGRLDGRLANVLKRRLDQLPRHGRALDVPVGPQRLGHRVRLLRVDDAVGVVLGSEVPLQAHDDDGDGVGALEGLFYLVDPLDLSSAWDMPGIDLEWGGNGHISSC